MIACDDSEGVADKPDRDGKSGGGGHTPTSTAKKKPRRASKAASSAKFSPICATSDAPEALAPHAEQCLRTGQHEAMMPQKLSPERDLNLCSAFAHVVADTLRTLTVMACALLVSIGGTDPVSTDAVGSLVVAGLIVAVAAYILYEACLQAKELLANLHSPVDGTETRHVPASAVAPSGDTSSSSTTTA